MVSAQSAHWTHTKQVFEKAVNEVSRLGGGEYNGGGGMATWNARILFLDAVAGVNPEVLASLKNDILPLWKSRHILQWNDVTGDLRKALESWAAGYNLAFDWVYRTALVTLWSWSLLNPEDIQAIAGQWQHDGYAYWVSTSRDERHLTFNHAGWDPTAETAADFRKRVLVYFNEYLEAYMQRLAGLAEGRGLEKAPELRNPDQFELLAKWQVCDYKTFGELARASYVTRQAATMAIQRAAERCGIPIPRGEQGKPGSVGRPPEK